MPLRRKQTRKATTVSDGAIAESLGLIPLVVGVTGHRDLRNADVPRLEEQVRSILAQLRRGYPATPLLVLSPLAEGADRLVGEVGLACGAELIVPLPLARQEYERDFATESSKQAFATMLAKAASCFAVPLADGNTPESVQQYGEPRNRQYAAVGIYVARHCQLLLALWDGDEGEKTGGTSQIVRLRLDGLPSQPTMLRSAISYLENGPVYHIITPHLKRPEPVGRPFDCRELFPEIELPTLVTDGQARETEGTDHARQRPRAPRESFAILWKHIDQFNRDVRRLGARLAAAIRQSESYLCPDEAAAHLDHGLRQLRRYYAVADTLALHFQVWRRRLWTILCGLGVLGIVLLSSSEALARSEAARAIVLATYLAVVVLAFVLVGWGEGVRRAGITGYRSRHLDYRALAEGMRVQFFWRLGGLAEEVADHYLPKQKSELEWIRQAIRTWNLPRTSHSCIEPAAADALPQDQMVQTYWIEDQAKYFLRAQRRNAAKTKRLRTWARAFFLGGLILALVVLLQNVLPARPGETERFIRHGLGIVLVSTAVALFGALEVYVEKMALSQEAKQYDSMARLFSRALKEFRAALTARDEPRLQQITRELGREALSENGDWVLLHRERPMELRFG